MPHTSSPWVCQEINATATRCWHENINAQEVARVPGFEAVALIGVICLIAILVARKIRK